MENMFASEIVKCYRSISTLLGLYLPAVGKRPRQEDKGYAFYSDGCIPYIVPVTCVGGGSFLVHRIYKAGLDLLCRPSNGSHHWAIGRIGLPWEVQWPLRRCHWIPTGPPSHLLPP